MSYKLHDIFRRQIVDVVYSVLYFCWHGSLHAFTVFVIVNVHKNGIFLLLSSNLNLMPEQKKHQISKEKRKC